MDSAVGLGVPVLGGPRTVPHALASVRPQGFQESAPATANERGRRYDGEAPSQVLAAGRRCQAAGYRRKAEVRVGKEEVRLLGRPSSCSSCRAGSSGGQVPDVVPGWVLGM